MAAAAPVFLKTKEDISKLGLEMLKKRELKWRSEEVGFGGTLHGKISKSRWRPRVLHAQRARSGLCFGGVEEWRRRSGNDKVRARGRACSFLSKPTSVHDALGAWMRMGRLLEGDWTSRAVSGRWAVVQSVEGSHWLIS